MKRVVTTWRLARITAVATLAGAVAPLAAAPVALAARDGGATEYAFAKPVSTKLNTTGRRIHMPVPFKDETAMLGELVIVINPDDSVLVPKAALVNALTPVFDKAALERLHGVRDADGQVTIQDLRAAGFDVRFDPAQMQLVLHADPDQRPVGDLSLARRRGPDASANVVLPAKVSGYLNVNAGFDYLWGDATGNEDTATTLDFESVFRFWNVVVENEATFETGASTFVCPVSARCLFDHAGGFKRRRSRVVYDMPDSQLRVQAGDADVYGTSFQRAPDVLGVTVEKSPRKLKPGENIRPTGKSSFRIERPSDIDVMVNGDGNNNAPTTYALTTLDDDATAGTLTLPGWLAYKMKFANPYMLTGALAQESVALQMMLLTTGSANVPLVTVQQPSGLGAFTPINPGLRDSVALGWTSDAPAQKIVGFDRRFAIERIVDVGATITEIEQFITRQVQVLVMTEAEGYAIIDKNAINILNVNA